MKNADICYLLCISRVDDTENREIYETYMHFGQIFIYWQNIDFSVTESFRLMEKDGRFDRIYKKWFQSTDWFKYVR